MGLVVLAAGGAAGGGAGGADTLAAAERCREAMEMWFMIDTLEYLRKGGRIGAAQAWLGSALQIKPILTLGEEITPVERVRTRRPLRSQAVATPRSCTPLTSGGTISRPIPKIALPIPR
jgi:fatty acid-binding protein DegV